MVSSSRQFKFNREVGVRQSKTWISILIRSERERQQGVSVKSSDILVLHDLIVWARWMVESNMSNKEIGRFLDLADYVGGLLNEDVRDRARIVGVLEEISAKFGCSAPMNHLSE